MRKAALYFRLGGEALPAFAAGFVQDIFFHGSSPSMWIARHTTEGETWDSNQRF
jgi:hypothetical protein